MIPPLYPLGWIDRVSLIPFECQGFCIPYCLIPLLNPTLVYNQFILTNVNGTMQGRICIRNYWGKKPTETHKMILSNLLESILNHTEEPLIRSSEQWYVLVGTTSIRRYENTCSVIISANEASSPIFNRLARKSENFIFVSHFLDYHWLY